MSIVVYHPFKRPSSQAILELQPFLSNNSYEYTNRDDIANNYSRELVIMCNNTWLDSLNLAIDRYGRGLNTSLLLTDIDYFSLDLIPDMVHNNFIKNIYVPNMQGKFFICGFLKDKYVDRVVVWDVWEQHFKQVNCIVPEENRRADTLAIATKKQTNIAKAQVIADSFGLTLTVADSLQPTEVQKFYEQHLFAAIVGQEWCNSHHRKLQANAFKNKKLWLGDV